MSTDGAPRYAAGAAGWLATQAQGKRSSICLAAPMPGWFHRPIRAAARPIIRKIIKQGNRWLRWAFVEAVAQTVTTDPQLRDRYEHLKNRGTNKARFAIARTLLTIAFQILRDQRLYERRGAGKEADGTSTISRLS